MGDAEGFRRNFDQSDRGFGDRGHQLDWEIQTQPEQMGVRHSGRCGNAERPRNQWCGTSDGRNRGGHRFTASWMILAQGAVSCDQRIHELNFRAVKERSVATARVIFSAQRRPFG